MSLEKQDTKEKGRKNRDSGNEKSPILGVFIVISIMFSLTMVFLIAWPILQRKQDVRKVEVILQIPQDSLATSLVLSKTEGQLGPLIEELNQQSQEITDKYELLIKSQETEADFFRLVSCIAAFVVALLGFLGYRTVKDIEARAGSIAEQKSERVSKDYTKNHLERTVETQLKGIVGDSTAAKLIHEQIMNEVNINVLGPLESRISSLESISRNALSYEYVPTEQPTESPFEQLGSEMVKLNEEGGGNNE